MAITLTVQLRDPIVPAHIARAARGTLQRVSGVGGVPVLTVHGFADGSLIELSEPGLPIRPGQMVAFGLQGRDDVVTLFVDVEGNQAQAVLSSAATRDATEQVLLLAIALQLAESQNANIDDGFGFWAPSGTIVPSTLIAKLAINPASDFVTACEALVATRQSASS